MQKAIITAIIVGVVFVAGVSALVIFGGNVNNAADDQRIILFYSNNCSHCANVEKFMQDNNIEGKLSIIKLEVSDKANAQNLLEKARYCHIDNKDIAVPFLWYGAKENQPSSQCLTGDTDIINFFQNFISNQ